MPEFKRVDPDCSFTLPETITVREQLAYYSIAGGTKGRDLWERQWEASKPLIGDWACALLPDKDTDLGEVTNPQIPLVLVWAVQQVAEYISGLEALEKNS